MMKNNVLREGIKPNLEKKRNRGKGGKTWETGKDRRRKNR